MSLFFFRNWTLDYLFIRPEEWERKHESHAWLRTYEVLDRREAAHVLDQIARRDENFLRELACDVLSRARTAHPLPGTGAGARVDARTLEELKGRLGAAFSEHGQAPRLAWFYICRRKRIAPAPQPTPDPFQKLNDAIEAAKRAPRGYVIVEAVDETGAPVPGLRLEVLLADGELATRATDARGRLRLDPIPQGQCHVRVPTLDGSAWHPAEGEAAVPVDKGPKRTHVVQRGENLTRIAEQHGMRGWQKLWDAPDNAPLRKKRKSPHMLHPSDEVVIPALQIHQITRPTDQTHRIVISEELVEFRVVLQDHNQLPYKDEPYELRLGGASDEAPRTGSTGADGKIVEQLPASTPKVEVFLPGPQLRWAFELNTLLSMPDAASLQDEADAETQGLAIQALQMRLLALGFPCGPADGVFGPRTRAALALWRGAPQAAQTASPGAAPEDERNHALFAELEAKFEVRA